MEEQINGTRFSDKKKKDKFKKQNNKAENILENKKNEKKNMKFKNNNHNKSNYNKQYESFNTNVKNDAIENGKRQNNKKKNSKQFRYSDKNEEEKQNVNEVTNEAAKKFCAAEQKQKKKKEEKEEDDDEELTFAINKNYAEKYESRKRQEELRKHKDLLEEEEGTSCSSSSSSEDEEGELLTNKVEKRIFDTLLKIKTKDKSIYDKNAQFFSDDDFEEEENSHVNDDENDTKSKNKRGKNKEDKRVTYSDMVRDVLLEEGAEAFVKDEDKENEKLKNQKQAPSYFEEQRNLKSAFMAAVDEEFGGENDAEENDEGDGLAVKQKTKEEEEHEDEAYRTFLKEEKAKKVSADDNEMMRHYWAADEELDESERFLRDYILNKAWLEDSGRSINRQHEPDNEEEEEEEKFLDAADEFESSYNFRYEENEGKEIQSHPRCIESSVRKKDTKRKEKREKRKLAKQEEKVRREELLKRLKNEKKKEIMEKIKLIQQVSGCDNIGIDKIDLEGDYDPETFDKEMQAMLGEDYYDKPDELEHPAQMPVPAGYEDILDVSQIKNEELKNFTKKQRKLLKRQQKLKKMAMDAAQGDEAYPPVGLEEEEEEEEEGEEEEKNGKEYKGEEELLYNNNNNTHDNNEDCHNENDDDMQHEWWMCDECNKGIPAGQKRFDCTECDNYTVCKLCFRLVHHPHQLVRKKVPKGCDPPEEMKGAVPNMRMTLDKYLDEYYQLDYEDIIGGDLPTRFKYKTVSPNSYGLTVDEILNKDDKELQQIAPMRRLAPYMTEGGEHTHTSTKRKGARNWFKGKKRSRGEISEHLNDEENNNNEVNKNYKNNNNYREKSNDYDNNNSNKKRKNNFNLTKNAGKMNNKKKWTNDAKTSTKPKWEKPPPPSNAAGISEQRLAAYKLSPN